MAAMRVAWLREHPRELDALPGEFDDVSETQSANLRRVGEAMVTARLYSRETTDEERAWSLRRLVTEIRKGTR